MAIQNLQSTQKIDLKFGKQLIEISFGDLFSQSGFQTIPVSRHLFETDVAQTSLLNQVFGRLQGIFGKDAEKVYQDLVLQSLDEKSFERAPAALGATLPESVALTSQMARLRQILSDGFNMSELKNLCFDLGVDCESLPTDSGKSDVIRELLQYLIRYDRVLELIRLGEQVRPDIAWVNIFNQGNDCPLIERLYPLGTTVPLKIGPHRILLLAVTWTELQGSIPQDNCTTTKLWGALDVFWQEMHRYVLDQDINAPLLGSGITGIPFESFHILTLNLLALKNAILERGFITTGKIRFVLYPPAHSDIDLNLIHKIWS